MNSSNVNVLDDDDFENVEEETLGDLKYEYLRMLESEGTLNEIVFDRSDWDRESDVYTMEYHGIEKLIAMVPDDVLIRQFGEYRVLPLLEVRDAKKETVT